MTSPLSESGSGSNKESQHKMLRNEEKIPQNYPKNPFVSEALGPVVQSIVSLTSSLRGQRVKCFMTL